MVALYAEGFWVIVKYNIRLKYVDIVFPDL